MRRRPHPLLAAFFALLLLGAQQAAFAHLIGHLGATAQVMAQPDDDGHGEALTLSHVCTTCVGLSALDGAPPPVLPVLAAAAGTYALPTAPAVAVGAASFSPYLARAPPAVL